MSDKQYFRKQAKKILFWYAIAHLVMISFCAGVYLYALQYPWPYDRSGQNNISIFGWIEVGSRQAAVLYAMLGSSYIIDVLGFVCIFVAFLNTTSQPKNQG